MKNKFLLLISVILILTYLMSFQDEKTHFSLSENNNIYINVKLSNGNIERMLLDDYIVGVVAGEMPASFNEEALKAQAIVSRTYALYKMNKNKDYDVLSSTSDQVFITKDEMKEKWGDDYDYYYSKIKDIVDSTSGLYISYDGKPICAYYFAISNGYTENSIYVFKSEYDYIKSVNSELDKNVKNYEVKKTIIRETFCNMLNIPCERIIINNQMLNETGHTISIDINNKTFSGIEIRSKLNLRSTDFKIDVYDDYVEITTRGYGHGVGMSQYGANELAKLGYDYQYIINYYYQEIIIEKINV